jgi:hypothetical protein
MVETQNRLARDTSLTYEQQGSGQARCFGWPEIIIIIREIYLARSRISSQLKYGGNDEQTNGCSEDTMLGAASTLA